MCASKFNRVNSSHIVIVCFIITALGIYATNAYAQEAATQRLNDSPRHHEWVQVKYNDRTVHAFLVFPEISEKATSVLIIHENRGLTDWVRSVADQLAEAGYVAIAPDLLSGMGPDGGKTSDFPDRNAARDALYQLTPEQVTADLKAVAEYVTKLPACNGKLAVGGFCWGGSQTFRFATNHVDLRAAFVFYGTAPSDPDTLKTIHCPVYGFYGGNDARVTSTVETTQEQMKTANKIYEPVSYEGAGHGFLRAGEETDASEANITAKDEAWVRWLSLLKKVSTPDP